MNSEFIDTTKRPSVYFYHIPKTGGMSMRSFLADQYRESDRCPSIEWADLAKTSDDAMAGYRLFYGHFSANLADALPPGVKTFTFLRQPLERTISAIRHTMRDPAFSKMYEEVRGASLRDVIYRDGFMEQMRNSQTTLLSCDVPPADIFARALQAQAAGRRFELGELRWKSSIAKALARLDSFHYVGLMEHYPASVQGLCRAFNFVPPEAMPELNRARDSIDYARELDAGDIAHIESFLDEDLIVYAAAKAKFDAGCARAETIAKLLAEGVLKPVPAPRAVDLGAPFAGSGWYRPEVQSGGMVRWSGPKTTAQLYLPLDRGERRAVRLLLWRKELLDEIEVSVEGEDAAIRRFQEAGKLGVEIELPALPGGGVNLSTIVVDSKSVKTPPERGGSDLRTLGVMLTSVDVA